VFDVVHQSVCEHHLKGSPIFSIIIPTFNRAHVINRAIQSVMHQTFDNFELIIVDDGSTDNTKEIVQRVKDSRLYYVFQENKGVSAARNAGVVLSRGRYITFLDSDDEALPEWLEHFVKAFERDKNTEIVCVGAKIEINGAGDRKEIPQLPRNMGKLFNNQQCLFRPPGVFAVHRDLFDAVGGYAEELQYGENTELMIRLISRCKSVGGIVVSIGKSLVIYNKQPSDKSKIHTHQEARLKSTEFVLARHVEKFREDHPALGLFLATAGVSAAKLKKYDRARNYFLEAIIAQPRNWKNYGRLFLALLPALGCRYWMRNED
jgi:glycosyltransferase involved in cell wall biosynthesis